MKSPFQTKTRFSIQTAKKMKRKSQGLPRKLAQQESHKLKWLNHGLQQQVKLKLNSTRTDEESVKSSNVFYFENNNL
jgi:hypothetical protein